MHHKIMDCFREGLWQEHTETQGLQLKTHLIRYLKIFTLSAQAFIMDNGALRASALTLYTLLSIVPVIAMLFWYR